MKMSAPENRRYRSPWVLWLVTLLLIGACVLAVPPVAAQGGQIEPPEAIRAAAESFIRSQLPRDANIASITAGSLDNRLRLVKCTSGMQGVLPPGSALQARTMVGVTCAGPVRWTVYVPVTVESRISVLVLKHPVARDTRLAADDVTVETRKVTGMANALLTDVSELRGRVVRRPLPAGTTLAVDMFMADLVIRHGQDVTLVASSGGIEVRAAGRALSDAAGGARLKVQNLSSMKVVEGVVEGPDLVRVAQ